MLSPDLTAAFQFYMRDARHRPAFYYAQGYNGRNAWPERAYGIAKRALELARADGSTVVVAIEVVHTDYVGEMRYASGCRFIAMPEGFANLRFPPHDKPARRAA